MIETSLFLIGTVLLFSFSKNSKDKDTYVKDITELNAAIDKANLEDEIMMINGVWNAGEFTVEETFPLK
ncbi:hypothetical protein [Kriegella aquimaris]|uniref:Uncharacterized protein n=1 Tax=Kriegella aquimaris TaxID=192904 RepID=A0A1G9XW08_9FLAO|nr:hypothetical protein [Kriegella aquimaris]SDN00999.1 hypothetical protein SAMN04488514_11943 [Kriegella aquimaris]